MAGNYGELIEKLKASGEEMSRYDSFEQFWLALLMSKKYNKSWKEAHWVKGEDIAGAGPD